jgi:hypothetical protein
MRRELGVVAGRYTYWGDRRYSADAIVSKPSPIIVVAHDVTEAFREHVETCYLPHVAVAYDDVVVRVARLDDAQDTVLRVFVV